MPHWTQSIRFRLSLFYALSLFTSGALLIGGIYMWQLERLDEPQLVERQVTIVHPVTGRPITVNQVDGPELVEAIEYASYVQTLDNLKRGSLGALGILFIVSFGTSWWVAGLALRPVHRMTRVARDITATDLSRRIGLPGPNDELKGLADTFDAMLDRLETGFEDQRRFVQDASHELRNPLASARANLELALSDPDASPEDLRRSAEVAHRSTERMSTLVEELLIQARSGVPEFSLDDVDLVTLAGEVVDEHQAAAAAKKVGLNLEGPDGPLETGQEVAGPGPSRVHIKGDGAALRRALGNLVSNALKASPPGSSVTVTVDLARRRGRGQEAVVAVADQGPGLSKDDQRHVFDRFWRGATSDGGAGLGLSIVNHIVSRHGGQVTVNSKLGSGSTFAFRLPTGNKGPDRPRMTSWSARKESLVGGSTDPGSPGRP